MVKVISKIHLHACQSHRYSYKSDGVDTCLSGSGSQVMRGIGGIITLGLVFISLELRDITFQCYYFWTWVKFQAIIVYKPMYEMGIRFQHI